MRIDPEVWVCPYCLETFKGDAGDKDQVKAWQAHVKECKKKKEECGGSPEEATRDE